MSKPIPVNQSIVHLEPDAQIALFARMYEPSLDPARLAAFSAHADSLGLRFTPNELTVLAALDHPAKVQEFLNTQIYYNNDHASVELEETAFPPRGVLRSGLAHCFEGALFAYAVDFLHGYNPHLAVVEASQDSEHNLVVWRDKGTGLYGCNAHSAFPHLDGRAAHYASIHALVESYVPYYYSDRTHDPRDLTIVGYSDEFDLIAKYGQDWIASLTPLWDIYHTYIDSTWRFHYLNGDSGTAHLYPVIRALEEKWIEIDERGKPYVCVDNLPPRAQNLWDEFWKLHHDNETYRRPRGEEAEVEKDFMRLTGTTPIDLDDNAFDFQFFLQAGYRVGDIVKGR